MCTKLAGEVVRLGHAVARERGQRAVELFGDETLESENARRLVVRRLRAAHPELSFQAILGVVDDELGYGTDRSRDMDPIEVRRG